MLVSEREESIYSSISSGLFQIGIFKSDFLIFPGTIFQFPGTTEIMLCGKWRIPDEKLGQGYFEPLLNLKK